MVWEKGLGVGDRKINFVFWRPAQASFCGLWPASLLRYPGQGSWSFASRAETKCICVLEAPREECDKLRKNFSEELHNVLIDAAVHHSKFLVIKLHTDCGISTKEGKRNQPFYHHLDSFRLCWTAEGDSRYWCVFLMLALISMTASVSLGT